MKYQGLVELSVRTYLGITDGVASWRHLKYVVGIKIKDKVYDCKTLEEYQFIPRTIDGRIAATHNEVVIGETYAIETINDKFKEQNIDNDRKLKRYINNSVCFSEEYKNAKTKCKVLIKEK